jgi:hypothetical protein
LLGRLNVAVTFWAAFIVTMQVPVPEQPPPLHPPKVDGEVGLAIRVTVALAAKSKLQVGPQSIPAGELVIVPLPVPALVTVKV